MLNSRFDSYQAIQFDALSLQGCDSHVGIQYGIDMEPLVGCTEMNKSRLKAYPKYQIGS